MTFTIQIYQKARKPFEMASSIESYCGTIFQRILLLLLHLRSSGRGGQMRNFIHIPEMSECLEKSLPEAFILFVPESSHMENHSPDSNRSIFSLNFQSQVLDITLLWLQNCRTHSRGRFHLFHFASHGADNWNGSRTDRLWLNRADNCTASVLPRPRAAACS